jgi:hypothetical protein
VGFEPTEPFGSATFKAAAFGHSATPPKESLDRPMRSSGFQDRQENANVQGAFVEFASLFASLGRLALRAESGDVGLGEHPDEPVTLDIPSLILACAGETIEGSATSRG